MGVKQPGATSTSNDHLVENAPAKETEKESTERKKGNEKRSREMSGGRKEYRSSGGAQRQQAGSVA